MEDLHFKIYILDIAKKKKLKLEKMLAVKPGYNERLALEITGVLYKSPEILQSLQCGENTEIYEYYKAEEVCCLVSLVTHLHRSHLLVLHCAKITIRSNCKINYNLHITDLLIFWDRI